MSALAAAGAPAVEIRDLRVELTGSGDDVVDEIRIEIHAGEVLGLVGESGCGKTTIGMALLGHCRAAAAWPAGRCWSTGATSPSWPGAICGGCAEGTVSYIPQDPGRR